MLYATWIKVSKAMVADQPAFAKIISSNNRAEKYNQLRKSIRLMNPVIRISDQEGDNFVKNLVTVVTEYDGYKVPRIVKRLLFNSLK